MRVAFASWYCFRMARSVATFSPGKPRRLGCDGDQAASAGFARGRRRKEGVSRANLFHRLFGAVQIDLTIPDRFGNSVKPKEWFLVPLQAIDEAVKRIVDGSVTAFAYDPASAELSRIE